MKQMITEIRFGPELETVFGENIFVASSNCFKTSLSHSVKPITSISTLFMTLLMVSTMFLFQMRANMILKIYTKKHF
jgi:hypothetical protein